MLFNSIEFVIFLPIVFALYWFAAKKGLRLQNTLLLVASYFFYGAWDTRFLFLLLFSTLLDYFSGLKIRSAGSTSMRTFWLWLSVCINLGFLGIFKYYNFFAQSFADAFSRIGVEVNPWTLKVILPIGISFYTFHGLSYVIDIYKSRIEPEKSFIDYSLFVSFFPLLVAGPIERATHLLPQLKKTRVFEYSTAVDGLRQILWGLFKKIVIADNCAKYANLIFNDPDNYSGSTKVIGAVFFAFQIYCDFSGYSDIALGTARLFGIELLRNFAYPYFSRDIAEFWRRWHISLTTWFRDYVYVPLGGSKGGLVMTIRNTFIIFIVSGFWHGANWTFIVWGLLNALYFLPLLIFRKNRNHLDTVATGRLLPTPKEFLQMAVTFALTTFAWIFFRAENVHEAFYFISGIASWSLFSVPQIRPWYLVVMIVLFFTVEWLGRENEYATQRLFSYRPRFIRWTFYYGLLVAIYAFSGNEQQFIYFQF